MRIDRVVAVAVVVLSLLPGQAAAADCEFVLGFKALRDLIPERVGDCLDREGHNPDNGDGLQHTTAWHGQGGLLVWRKADNWTAFTDGAWTWVSGPEGLRKRLNSERFAWEADGPVPAAAAPAAAAAPPAEARPGPPSASAAASAEQACAARVGTALDRYGGLAASLPFADLQAAYARRRCVALVLRDGDTGLRCLDWAQAAMEERWAARGGAGVDQALQDFRTLYRDCSGREP